MYIMGVPCFQNCSLATCQCPGLNPCTMWNCEGGETLWLFVRGKFLQDLVSTDSTLGQLWTIPQHLVDFILWTFRGEILVAL